MADKNLNISTIWHGKPKIQASGTLYFSTNTSNGTIHYWGTLTETLTQAAYGAGYGTGYADEIYIQVNGSTIASGIGKPKTQSTYSTGWPSSWNISFDSSFSYINNATVAVYASCHKSSSQAPDREGSCPEGDVGILLGSFNTRELPPYNPYTPPQTYEITDWSRKDRASAASRTISYRISGGTGEIHWVAPEIYTLSKTWTGGKWNDIKGSIQSTRVYPPSNVEIGNGQEPGKSYKLFDDGTSKSVTETNKSFGNYTGSRTDVRKLSECLSPGSKYRLAIHFSDKNYEWVSGNYDYLYTYTEPTLTRCKSI